MNWLDWLIAAVAPEAGLRRAAARYALKNLYEAARPDRSMAGWLTTGNDPNAEIGSQVARIRNRARDLGRNDPYISRAYDILTAKIVGGGIRPRLAEEVGQQTRARTLDSWSRFVDECDPDRQQDLYGLQMIAVRTMIESGEALVRFIPTPGRGLRIPIQIKILEPDWIDADRDQALDDGGRITQGVEFAPDGRRLAYWLFSEHPGAQSFATRNPTTYRLPAEFIAPLYRQQRPDQVHGVPWAAPIVSKARHLDDINEARMIRAKIQGCFGVFVTKTDPSAPLGETETQDGRRREKISPGLIEYLRPDEQVSFASPPAGEGDDEWMRLILHSMAAGIGVTYAQLTGDLTQVNYSSMRAGAIDHWSLLDQWQRLVVRPMLCQPIWRMFERYEAPRQQRGWFLSVDWDFPERAMIDPVKDGQALDAALFAGRKTFTEVIAGRGRDPETHLAELVRERKEFDVAELKLPHILPEAPPAVAPSAPDQGPASPDGNADPGDEQQAEAA